LTLHNVLVATRFFQLFFFLQGGLAKKKKAGKNKSWKFAQQHHAARA